jgi:hypothetical protein
MMLGRLAVADFILTHLNSVINGKFMAETGFAGLHPPPRIIFGFQWLRQMSVETKKRVSCDVPCDWRSHRVDWRATFRIFSFALVSSPRSIQRENPMIQGAYLLVVE